MLYEKFRTKTNEKSILSAIDTLGQYDFYTSLISLDALTIDDINLASQYDDKIVDLDLDVAVQRVKVFALAAHEYTHFIDSTSTVWGVDHLVLMNDAYSSDYRRRGKENDFYKAKRFFNHIRKIKYPEYYTTIEQVDSDRPWSTSFSIGKLFNHNGILGQEPILFTRFYNSSGDNIARSPISPVSILEASAMSQEILIENQILSSLKKDQLVVERQLYSQRILGNLYGEHLTEYSVCVHLVANQQQCSDVLQAFMLTSLIARTVLNATSKVFKKVARCTNLNDITGVPKGHPFIESLILGLEHNNIGILFYLVTQGLPQSSYETDEYALRGVVASLESLGLAFEQIYEDAKKHIDQKLDILTASSFSSIVELSEASERNFEVIGLEKMTIPFGSAHLPKVMLSDESETFIFENNDNTLQEYSLDQCFDELVPGERWVKNFAEGCI